MTRLRSTPSPPHQGVDGRRGPPAVLAIVVTHRGRAWIRQCLSSLTAQTYGLMDVLVVDDASPDSHDVPTLKRVVKRHCRRRRWGYLRTSRPLGFGGAINWALSRIRTDADLLLFVHDDTALEPDAVELMVRRLEADRATAIVGPKIASWGDARRLEEVGMAVDRFGYPYKGLEPGEIDLGQHDDPAEVFYVTSTCMLMRHTVFKSVRGWDARMRAFAEDLDLCWRARVAGHAVRVEPRAKARHAIALATGLRRSPFTPARYYIRRNRLRSIAKNASGMRLLLLVPQFVLLAAAEMIAFVVLRQYGEIVNIARALAWNLLCFPQTLAERFKVQRDRQIGDRSLRRLTVRETTRMRAYIGHQAERLEEAWGRRAEVITLRADQVRAIRERLSDPSAVFVCVLILCVLLGFRNVLWSPSPSFGQLLRYPDEATAVVGAYGAVWRDAGLGTSWPTSPALVLLGVFPVVLLGATGVAPKLLLATLAAVAFTGVYRIMGELAGRPARWVAGLVYVLGAVGYAGIRAGDLGALVLGAAAPFALHALLRLTGWLRPPGWDAGAEIARLGLAAGVGASMVPASLVVWLWAGTALAAGRAVVAARSPLRQLLWVAGGVLLAWALLLPWSLTWWSRGGETWGPVPLDSAPDPGLGLLQLLLGRSPELPAPMVVAPALLGVLAAVVSSGRRRTTALALWLVIAACGVHLEIIERAPAWLSLTPARAAVLPSLCLAVLSGVATGACLLDLPRRELGLWQPLALAAVTVAAAIFVAGLAPTLWRAEWTPGGGREAADPATIDQISSVLAAEEAASGRFRVLWIGSGWFGASSAGARTPYSLTSAWGMEMTDLFAAPDASGRHQLERALDAIEDRATDRGGRWLGGFDIGFVVLERGLRETSWLAQRDLAVSRREAGYLLLENQAQSVRAGVHDRLPPAAGNVAALRDPVDARALEARSPWFYEAGPVAGPGELFVAESRAPGWAARLGGQELRRVASAWGNAFEVPSGLAGRLVVAVERPAGYHPWLVGLGLLWLAAFGAATVRRTAPGRHRAE